MEYIKIEHETSLFFCLLFFPQIIFILQSILSSLPTVSVPFILAVFPFRHFLLFQCNIPLEPYSFFSCLLIFQSSWTITIPFCAWSKPSHHYHRVLPAPFWHNTYTERPILLMKLARSSYDLNIFSKCKFNTRGKRGNFIVNYKGIYALCL